MPSIARDGIVRAKHALRTTLVGRILLRMLRPYTHVMEYNHMPTPIIWLHGDSLSPADPALVANPGAPALFVFDESFLRSAGLSFKRLLFIYECALEALAGRDGEIRRGEVIAELLDFRAARGGDAIHVSASVAPRFKSYAARLRETTALVIHQPQPLASWRGEAPRRFSAYWRKVEAEAMRPTGDGPPELR